MRKIFSLLLLFFAFFLPSFTSQAQSIIYDLDKLTCLDFYKLSLSEKESDKLRQDQQDPNDPPFQYKNNKALMMVIWTDGWLSDTYEYQPFKRILKVNRALKDTCEQPFTLFTSSFNKTWEEYNKNEMHNLEPWAFPNWTCGQFLVELLENNADVIDWTIWFDGFFTKGTEFNYNKLEKNTDELPNECFRQLERNILSVIKEIGQY